MNDKWPLYLIASINKHFEAEVVSQSGLPIVNFYEGQPRDNAGVNAENIVEVRFTGPFFTKQSKKVWRSTLIINCAIQAIVNDKNNYKIWRVIGLVVKAMAKDIPIKNHEDGVVPQTFNCLSLLTVKNDISINFLGQIDSTLKKLQAEVTAHFTVDLEDNA